MASARKRYRVLVAEDDEGFLNALEAALRAHGSLEVVGRARNGREAVELAEELQPDLVVMDVEMPVLAISGHDYEERALEIRAAGAADYVRKARLVDELAAVAAALASGQPARR